MQEHKHPMDWTLREIQTHLIKAVTEFTSDSDYENCEDLQDIVYCAKESLDEIECIIEAIDMSGY